MIANTATALTSGHAGNSPRRKTQQFEHPILPQKVFSVDLSSRCRGRFYEPLIFHHIHPYLITVSLPCEQPKSEFLQQGLSSLNLPVL